jgi:hypothetical protein
MLVCLKNMLKSSLPRWCRGVVWDDASQRWAVCLSHREGQPEKQLGLFYTEEAAACAYDTLAMELYGPATPTNFHSHGARSASDILSAAECDWQLCLWCFDGSL